MISIAIKAFQRVRGYNRKTGPVRGYSRNTKFPARVSHLYNKHHKDIEKWATISTHYQRAKGVHFQSPDDAILAGQEEGLHALRRYQKHHGPVENFVRPSIKFGILKHLAWERGKGLTGTRTIYDLLHRATTDEQREKIIERFPEITEVPETLADEDNSIESVMEQAYALMKRDRLLDEIEKEFKVTLKQARENLKKQEKGRSTWKTVSLARRQLEIYKMKAIDNLSYREIAGKLGIGVARVFDDYHIAAEAIQKMRKRRTVVTKKALASARSNEERFLLNLERLQRAVDNDYPEAYIDFILDRLAMLMVLIAESDHATQSTQPGTP